MQLQRGERVGAELLLDAAAADGVRDRVVQVCRDRDERCAGQSRERGGKDERGVVRAVRVERGEDRVGHRRLQWKGTGIPASPMVAAPGAGGIGASPPASCGFPRVFLRAATDAPRARMGHADGMDPHVVIAGGGIGALEGLLALQDLAGERLRISVLTASRHLTYRALSVAEPFGGDPAPRFDWEQITRDRGVRWIPDMLPASSSTRAGSSPGTVPTSIRWAAARARRPARDRGSRRRCLRRAARRRRRPRGDRRTPSRQAARHGVRGRRRRRLDAPALRAGAADGRARPAARAGPPRRDRHPGIRPARHVRGRGERRRGGTLAPRASISVPGRSPRSTTTAGSGWSSRVRWRSTSRSRCR